MDPNSNLPANATKSFCPVLVTKWPIMSPEQRQELLERSGFATRPECPKRPPKSTQSYVLAHLLNPPSTSRTNVTQETLLPRRARPDDPLTSIPTNTLKDGERDKEKKALGTPMPRPPLIDTKSPHANQEKGPSTENTKEKLTITKNPLTASVSRKRARYSERAMNEPPKDRTLQPATRSQLTKSFESQPDLLSASEGSITHSAASESSGSRHSIAQLTEPYPSSSREDLIHSNSGSSALPPALSESRPEELSFPLFPLSGSLPQREVPSIEDLGLVAEQLFINLRLRLAQAFQQSRVNDRAKQYMRERDEARKERDEARKERDEARKDRDRTIRPLVSDGNLLHGSGAAKVTRRSQSSVLEPEQSLVKTFGIPVSLVEAKQRIASPTKNAQILGKRARCSNERTVDCFDDEDTERQAEWVQGGSIGHSIVSHSSDLSLSNVFEDSEAVSRHPVQPEQVAHTQTAFSKDPHGTCRETCLICRLVPHLFPLKNPDVRECLLCTKKNLKSSFPYDARDEYLFGHILLNH